MRTAAEQGLHESVTALQGRRITWRASLRLWGPLLIRLLLLLLLPQGRSTGLSRRLGKAGQNLSEGRLSFRMCVLEAAGEARSQAVQDKQYDAGRARQAVRRTPTYANLVLRL